MGNNFAHFAAKNHDGVVQDQESPAPPAPPENSEVFKAIETFGSKSEEENKDYFKCAKDYFNCACCMQEPRKKLAAFVKEALSDDIPDTKKLALLNYQENNMTTLQLAVRKSKILPGGLVKVLFDAYIESLNHSHDDGVMYQDMLKIIRDRSNYKPLPDEIPSTMLKEDIHGFTLLHYAILYNSSARRVHDLIYPRVKDKRVYPRFQGYLYKSDEAPITPLHLAILSPLRLSTWDRLPHHIIKLLLEADESKISLFEDIRLPRLEDSPKTPLDLAILCKCSREIIIALVDADVTGNKEQNILKRSLVKSDDEDDDYPLLAAIKKKASLDVIKVLVDADWSKDRKTLIHVFPKFLSSELPEKYVPLVIDDTLMTYLLYPDDQLLPWSEKLAEKLGKKLGKKPGEKPQPQRLIPNKYFYVLSTNTVMQRFLNKEWCITYSFTYLLLFDFYLYILAVFSFMQYWEQEEGTNWARYVLYIVSSLLLSRKVMGMNANGLARWVKRPDNWLDVVYCSLLLYCISCVTNQNPENSWNKNQRNVVMITGGLSWIMPLISLRVMFSSFALFVSGCLNILLTLVPFVTSGLLLLASFAFMYQVDSLNNQEPFKICYNENITKTHLSESCPYWQAFGNLSYNVLGSFQQEILSQPTTTATRALSVSFAIIAVILLLNVIIAIINQKWDAVTEKGFRIFYGGRSRYLVMAIGPCNESNWNKLIQDATFWTLETWTDIIYGMISFPVNVFIIAVWIFYGFFTFGILWPTPIRTGFHRHFCPFCDTLNNKNKNTLKKKSFDGCLWSRYRKWFVDQADDSLDDPLRLYWDALMQSFVPSDKDQSFGQHIIFTFLPFFSSACIMFYWLLLGIPTFGLLWPRQVREFLFCPKIDEGEQGKGEKKRIVL